MDHYRAANTVITQSDEATPERRLIGYMLALAVEDATATSPHEAASEDAKRYQGAQQTIDKRIAAKHWLFSESTAPMSARWCADVLDIDLHSIRQAVIHRASEIGRVGRKTVRRKEAA